MHNFITKDQKIKVKENIRHKMHNFITKNKNSMCKLNC